MIFLITFFFKKKKKNLFSKRINNHRLRPNETILMIDININIAKKKKYLSIKEKIPEEFLFDGINEYLKTIKFHCYSDNIYIESKLIPHFEKTLRKIDKYIIYKQKKLEKQNEKAQNSFSNSQLLEIPNKNFLNKNIIRKINVIYLRNEELNRGIIFTKITIYQNQLDILEKLKKLVQYLIKYPRYYFCNLSKITQKIKNILTKSISDLILEFNASNSYIMNLKNQLELIPEPFTIFSQNREFIKFIISIGINLRDPYSKIIPFSEEFEYFRRFLESPQSPIQIMTIKETDPTEFFDTVRSLSYTILDYCDIKTLDTTSIEVLDYLLISFLFDQNYEIIEANVHSKIHCKDTFDYSEYQQLTLQELGLYEPLVPKEFLNKTSLEFFYAIPLLRALPNELLYCLFYYNPIDIYSSIKKIDMAIFAYLSENNLPTDKDSIECYLIWKLLFIVSAVPNVELIFDKICIWNQIPIINESYKSICYPPQKVIKDIF